ncbi:hypothetical protein FA95DRAFT_1673747 [Auriscalpium vulgare]|uniref:Uncharacterized protein n=1 Tax=Auriscalpium vulgare TaxID=40419 RepID=A0ACB8SB55_9AGAM|nr:hypothetical protein FA95DRAFT_1673747 [Auriscalpium vulgare]
MSQLTNKLLCRISSDSNMSPKSPEQTLNDFVSRDPAVRYTFDSERDAPQSEICRDTENKECIKLQMNAKRLFEAMQANGFYCALPSNPARTHMECTPIPKS